MRILLAMVPALVSCAASPARPQPLGVKGHLLEATRCEDEAVRHDALAERSDGASRDVPPTCSDAVLAAQATTVVQPAASLMNPCWTSAPAAAARHREEAERLRAEARSHRAVARALAKAEATSCASLAAEDLEHTPFAHRDDVAAVSAELDHGEVRGARIQFRPVAGLTAAWMQTAIGCHRARAAALGFDPTYMGYDPTVLASVTVTVTDTAGGPLVVARAADVATALVVYGRAEDLVGEPR